MRRFEVCVCFRIVVGCCAQTSVEEIKIVFLYPIMLKCDTIQYDIVFGYICIGCCVLLNFFRSERGKYCRSKRKNIALDLMCTVAWMGWTKVLVCTISKQVVENIL